MRFFGVLWGTVGYWDLLGYAGGRGYRGLLQGTGGTVGYWRVLGVLGSNSGYFWILWDTKGYWGYSGGIAGTVGYCRYCRYWVVLGVLGGAGWYWGYLVVLGIKNDYCGVLHISAGNYRVLGGTWVHWGALVGTEGTGWFWGYSVVPEGALENYWVLGLLGRTVGSWGVK